MRAGADLRLLRAAVFAAACSALAAAGHVLGGGAGVPLWAVAAGALLTWAFALALTGRERRSWPGIALALALTQLALHLFFCLAEHVGASGGHGGHGPADGPADLAARLLCGDHGAISPERAAALLDDAGLPPAPSGAGAVAHGGGGWGAALLDGVATLGSWPMLLGHLLAALTAGWLLRQGEAALWLAVRLAVELLAAPRWARRLLTALRLL
ncbi:hypothetical protein, partial [Streptomyces sedi]|uniref:hypothetical protein n=1 Tax=Streptomyces sedi TaxID=555059 RepID=UPI0031E6A291